MNRIKGVLKLGWFLLRNFSLLSLLIVRPSQGTGPSAILFLIGSVADERMLFPLYRRFSSSTPIYLFLYNPSYQPRLFGKVELLPIDQLGHFRRRSLIAFICLDHKRQLNYHARGVGLTFLLRLAGVETVCVQHGGTKQSALNDLASSASKKIFVWSEIAAKEIERRSKNKEIYCLGNPGFLLRDFGTDSSRKITESEDEIDRPFLLVATCLHDEYASKEEHEQFLMDLLLSIPFESHFLRIKPHPLDGTRARLYSELAVRAGCSSSVEVLDPNISVYGQIAKSALVISRASGVVDDALAQGKRVLLYDLRADGPSAEYNNLIESGVVQRAIGPDDLKRKIKHLTDIRYSAITSERPEFSYGSLDGYIQMFNQLKI